MGMIPGLAGMVLASRSSDRTLERRYHVALLAIMSRRIDVANTLPLASPPFSVLNFCDVNVRREFCQLTLVVLKHFIQWSFLVAVYETREVANLAFELPFTG